MMGSEDKSKNVYMRKARRCEGIVLTTLTWRPATSHAGQRITIPRTGPATLSPGACHVRAP